MPGNKLVCRKVLFQAIVLALSFVAYLVLAAATPAEAATFTVNSTGDGPDSDTLDSSCNDGSGACTLRAAIQQANASVGSDIIAFNIPGAGPHTILLGSALPTVTDPVTIDGYTEPGASANTLAVGNNASLMIEVKATTASSSLVLNASSVVRGLALNGGGPCLCAIGAIGALGAGNHTIQGNFIGTNVAGTAPASTNMDGVELGSGGNLVGGTAPAERNLISGLVHGIETVGSASSPNQVLGNYIGTDTSGTAAVGNLNAIVMNGPPANLIIGGDAPGAGNVISGNQVGVVRSGDYGINSIIGNLIGTDATGTLDLGNTTDGIVAYPGGTFNILNNVISGNGYNGVFVGGSSDIIKGNRIGTAADGSTALGNGANGIVSSGGGTIGGTAPGEANIIAFNGLAGIANSGPATPIRANSIYSNGALGIDNFDGGNNELPPPIVTAVESASGTACANCIIDVFSDLVDEGRVYHGSTIADGVGNWSFGGSVSGPSITATATDGDGNTSEFSAPFSCSQCQPPPLSVGGIAGLLGGGAPRQPASASASLGAMRLAVPAVLALLLGTACGVRWFRRRI